MFSSEPIRKFVFYIFLKPSRCIQICSGCIAASCDPLTTGLVTLYRQRFITIFDNSRPLSMTPNFVSVHDTLPGIWVCILPLAMLMSYLWNKLSPGIWRHVTWHSPTYRKNMSPHPKGRWSPAGSSDILTAAYQIPGRHISVVPVCKSSVDRPYCSFLFFFFLTWRWRQQVPP